MNAECCTWAINYLKFCSCKHLRFVCANVQNSVDSHFNAHRHQNLRIDGIRRFEVTKSMCHLGAIMYHQETPSETRVCPNFNSDYSLQPIHNLGDAVILIFSNVKANWKYFFIDVHSAVLQTETCFNTNWQFEALPVDAYLERYKSFILPEDVCPEFQWELNDYFLWSWNTQNRNINNWRFLLSKCL